MCASPDYQAKVKQLEAPFVTLASGQTVSHADVAAATAEAFVRLRKQPEYARVLGAPRHKQKRRIKALQAAVKQDVAQKFGVELPSGFTIALLGVAAIIGFAFGPVVLFTVAIEAAFGWLIEKELTDNFDAVTG
jgi:hypothetical protein